MRQQYLLKSKGVSFSEQYAMTAEERAWWVKKIDQENEDIKRSSKGSRELSGAPPGP